MPDVSHLPDRTLPGMLPEESTQLLDDVAALERTIEPIAVRAYRALRDAGALLTDDSDVEPGSPQDRLSDRIVGCLAHFEAALGVPDVAAPSWWVEGAR